MTRDPRAARVGLRRSQLFAALLIAMIAATTTAAAQTEPNIYTGCLSSSGTISSVAIGSAPAKDCKRDVQITWSQTGPQGVPGPQGPEGPEGSQGEAGPQGAPGSLPDSACAVGSYVTGITGGQLVCSPVTSMVSPNGQFSVTVTDTGIVLKSATFSEINIGPVEISVDSLLTTIDSGISTNIRGGIVQLGSGGCAPTARVTDPVLVSGTTPPAGAPLVLQGSILFGSPTVLTCG